MKFIFFLPLFLLAQTATPQNFTIKFDTVNFAYNKGPFIDVLTDLFDETPLTNYLGMDKTKFFPIAKRGAGFEQILSLQQPAIIQLVNTDVLAIPGQEINGVMEGSGEFIKLKDSTNINYFFSKLREKSASVRIRLFSDTSTANLLSLYDTLKNFFGEELAYISSPESRNRYKINFSVISLIKQYCMTELGNFLFSPTYLKKDFSLTAYKKYKKDLNITEPRILMEFQQGRLFLQRHFFYSALPENNYDLAKTLNTDSFFRDTKIKKYLGYRYFARFYADQPILLKIKNFNTAFTEFKKSYSFLNDQIRALKRLEFQMKENQSTILSIIRKENFIKTDGTSISNHEIDQVFGGDKILYFWASWCLPCRQYLQGLKSNAFTYLGKHYSMIFISIDTKTVQWKKAQYPFLNSSNSFKIMDPTHSSLLKIYGLDKAVPRVLLLQDGKLIDPNIDKHLLLQE